MTINLTAERVNNNDTTVSIEFSGIKNEDFRAVGHDLIINSKGEKGVIFHIQNDNQTYIQSSGMDTVVFTKNFNIETDQIRVFYFNDSGLLADYLVYFTNFLEQYGLDDTVSVGDFDYENYGFLLKPRQIGNGGVVAIF